MCSFFVLVVIYINLGRVRLYHFIHLPNCRITVLAKVPGFCPCVVSTWPLISENALIQMNGAFQMKYCMGPNSAIFHLRIFGWGGIWTRVSQLRSRHSIHYSTSSRSIIWYLSTVWQLTALKSCFLVILSITGNSSSFCVTDNSLKILFFHRLSLTVNTLLFSYRVTDNFLKIRFFESY